MKIPFKKLRYAFGGAAISITEFIIPKIPLALTHLFMDTLFFVAYPIGAYIFRLHSPFLKNLDTAFEDKVKKSEKMRIVRKVLRNLFRFYGDTLYYIHSKNQNKITRDIEISNIEHIEEALKKGKGVIGLGAHMGNFILMSIRLTMSEIPFFVVTKDPKNEMLRNKYIKWKRSTGVKYIDAKTEMRATKDILRGLRQNTIVYLIADERKKKDGILVPFLGKPALTTPGPAVLSLRTGAPIIPMFVTKGKGYKHVIEILSPIDVEKTGNIEQDIYNLTEAANNVISDYIRKYPDQWAWTNPRWKI